jgi:hypothetical protein
MGEHLVCVIHCAEGTDDARGYETCVSSPCYKAVACHSPVDICMS